MIYEPYRFLKNDKATRYSKIVRSGRISPYDGKFWDAGQVGLWWSSRYYSGNTAAYHFDFNATNVFPSNSPYRRWEAFPLRCLSTVLRLCRR